MYGQVFKPLRDLKGDLYVKIVTYNPNENVKTSAIIPYTEYMDNYDNKNYDFYLFDSKETFTQNELNKVHSGNCLFCDTLLKRIRSNYCNKNCNGKHSRRLRDKAKIIFHKQVVIPIKGLNPKEGLNPENYYVVCDLSSKKIEHRFVKQSKCSIIVTEDRYHIPRYRINFDIKDSVRIKNVKEYKKFFMITEEVFWYLKEQKIY